MNYSQSIALLSLSTVMTIATVMRPAQAQSAPSSESAPATVVPTSVATPMEAASPSAPSAGSPSPSAPSIVPPVAVPLAPKPTLPVKPGTTAFPPTQVPPPTVPAPATSAAPVVTPESAPMPGTNPTSVKELKRQVAVPEFLNTPANPLLLPTQPAEVKLKGAQPLTLDQVIALAERNNRTIEQAKLQMEASRAAVREAEAARMPSISVQGDLTRGKSASTEIAGRQQLKNLNRDLNSDDFATRIQAQQSEAATRRNLQDQDDPRTNLTTSLDLRYDLFTSGRTAAQIRAAERQLRVSELQVDQAAAQIRFDVSDTYYQLQDAEEQIKISQAAIDSSQSSLNDTNAQFEAGLGTKFDVLRVQVQLANNKQQLTSAIANREIQRRRLAQRLSLPETVIVVPAEKEPKEAGVWPLSLEQTIVLAYKNRSELEQQLVQREISDARRKIALSALGPTISLVAQLNFLDSFDDSVGIGSGYTFAAQARWTLFDGGAAKAQADQRSKEKQIAESRFAEQRNTVRFEVEQAYATLLSNRASIATTTQAIEQATEAEKLAKLRFDAGVGTQTERIDAQSDLTRAKGNRVSAVIGYNRALAQLRRAVSNLPSDLGQIGRVAAK
jgi:outer membrane protein TolC